MIAAEPERVTRAIEPLVMAVDESADGLCGARCSAEARLR